MENQILYAINDSLLEAVLELIKNEVPMRAAKKALPLIDALEHAPMIKQIEKNEETVKK